jgi:L-ascorbate metabolism protein UlaG (beta-lactamase superfamily)
MRVMSARVRFGLSGLAVAVAFLTLRAAAQTVPGPPAPGVTVQYVANAGVLVSARGSRVLIDAPIREGIPPYATSSAADRGLIERAQPPFDLVDAVLVTHWHEDHFSAEAVAAHLSHNRRAVLVSSPEVVERVRRAAPALEEGRFRPVLPEPGKWEAVKVGDLTVRVLRIRHNPTRRLPEQHVGFLVGDGPAVLHTGDADPKADNFQLLKELPRVDLALVPFWFLLGEGDRRFVADAIAPARTVAMHLPPQDADEVRQRFAEANVDATLLVSPGTTVR